MQDWLCCRDLQLEDIQVTEASSRSSIILALGQIVILKLPFGKPRARRHRQSRGGEEAEENSLERCHVV